MNMEVLLILLVTSLACVLVGVFLMLRKLSMMTDAISHTILLGIVIGFFIANTLDTPLFLIGGVAIGVLSTWMIGALERTGKVNEDAAIGIVFPLFFGIAVILITLFAGNVHLDLDSVLLGEVTFAPLSRMTVLGISMPKALAGMLLGLLVNVAYIAIFYKELKLSSFDAVLAAVSGFSVMFIQYSLMTVVSFTAVLAFDAVGSILVIALMIGPAMSARLLVDELGEMIVASIIYALVNTFIGYILSIWLDVSVAGMIATVTGITFLITAIFAPETGVITRIIKRQDNKKTFERELLLLHLRTHEGQEDYAEEAGKDTIMHHLHWSDTKFDEISRKLRQDDEITKRDGIYYLTEKGHSHVDYISKFYGLPQLTNLK